MIVGIDYLLLGDEVVKVWRTTGYIVSKFYGITTRVRGDGLECREIEIPSGEVFADKRT